MLSVLKKALSSTSVADEKGVEQRAELSGGEQPTLVTGTSGVGSALPLTDKGESRWTPDTNVSAVDRSPSAVETIPFSDQEPDRLADEADEGIPQSISERCVDEECSEQSRDSSCPALDHERFQEGGFSSSGAHAGDEDPGLVYLCPGEGPDHEDTMSVVSDAKTQEELQEELSSLSRALEALEVESGAGVVGGSPSQGTSVISDQEQEHLVNLVSLYNSMGVKLMDARSYDEALGVLRKAETLAERTERWPAEEDNVRQRLLCITYNNLGCLFRRRSAPSEALHYLTRALSIGSQTPSGSHGAASTHLNVCAAYTSLKRHREALGHAERAALLVQRELFSSGNAAHGSGTHFHDGLAAATARLAATDSHTRRKAMRDSAAVLAMAYHNAALAHERLGGLTEARVSFARARAIADRLLGAKSHTATSLARAERAFLARHVRGSSVGNLSAAGVRAQTKKPGAVVTRSRSASALGRSSSSGNVGKAALLKPPPATQNKVRL